jgi:prolyl 4-hydroxylase
VGERESSESRRFEIHFHFGFRLTFDIARCIEDRANAFQGYPPFATCEVAVQRYSPAGEYKHNHDWFGETRLPQGRKRVTFMAYLEANCTGRGTNFPRLAIPSGYSRQEWCEFVDSEDAVEKGVTFKSVAGNAVCEQK